MDELALKLQSIRWTYGDKDLNAIAELTAKIEEAGKRQALISYSDLVEDVVFHYSNIGNGEPYRIRTYDWSGLDRKIIGDCLGYICVQSYVAYGFMASALVVERRESQPSGIFFEWMKSLDVLPNLREETVLAFWADQVKKACQWYAYGRR